MAACLFCWGTGGSSAVRVSRSLFLNHIHIHIQIHIHSANGLQNLHLHNTTMQNIHLHTNTMQNLHLHKSIYNNNLRRVKSYLTVIYS